MTLRERLARLIMPPAQRSGYDYLAAMLQEGSGSLLFGMGDSGQLTNWSYGQFAQEGYAQSAIVYGCMRWIQQGCSSIGLALAQDGEVLDPVPANLAPLAGLLARPNPTQAIDEFIEQGVLHQYMGGMQHIRRFGVGTETIAGRQRAKSAPELWLIDPPRLRLSYSQYGITEYLLDNREIIPLDEMLTVKFAHPGSCALGMSPLEPIRRQIDNYAKINQWNGNVFDNNGVPAGVLSVKGLYQLNDAERTKRQREWREQYEGVKNAGKVMVLDSEVSGFTKLAADYKDLEWLDGKQDLKREVCAVLGVPSVLVGDPASSTYSNYESALKALYLNTILPQMQHWAGELSAWLCPQYGQNLSIALVTDHIEVLAEDANARAERQSKRVHWTINELRAEDGLEELPLPDCDIPLKLLTGFGDPFDMGGDTPDEEQPKEEPPAEEEEEQDKARSRRAQPAYHPRSKYQTVEARAGAMNKAERDRAAFERLIGKAVRAYWQEQLERATAKLRSAGGLSTRGITDIVSFIRSLGEREAFVKKTFDVYAAAYERFAQDAFLDGGGDGKINILDNARVREHLARDLSSRSRLINETTAERVRAALDAGLAEGEGVSALTQRLNDLYEGFGSRSEMIARTETCRAQSIASREGWEEAGVPEKEWISAGDDAVRDSHAEADGQVVGINEPFIVGGLAAMGPGETGDPGEDINCRCTAAPITG